jgi:hypothetical protein
MFYVLPAQQTIKKDKDTYGKGKVFPSTGLGGP